MSKFSTKEINIKKVVGEESQIISDTLAVEEPLEIRLLFGAASNRTQKNISVTMRTPGHDSELAVGFLFTEGIIRSYTEIQKVAAVNFDANIVLVELTESAAPEVRKLERNFYTTSSCGVCGKSSIDSVRVVSNEIKKLDLIVVNAAIFQKLTEILRKKQAVFEQTGGLHASALFDLTGNLIELREDVGRHNALDKLIGACLEKNMLPLNNHILLLSGRASFELIQKAVMSGIKIIAAVGAPSSLAVELAIEFDCTLLGFLRDNRFNIYCGDSRLIWQENL